MPQCGGLMVHEPVRDLFEAFRLWRCVQCGARRDWLIEQNRHLSRPVVVERPTVLSDEAYQDWIDRLRRRRRSRNLVRRKTVLKILDRVGGT